GATATGFEGCITHGPWGTQGKSWIYMPEGFIESISIAHGGVIDSIKFQSYCQTGETQHSFFGGKGGFLTDTINIDYPKEYIVAISGTTGNYDGYNVVKSLCIVTNKKCYGPYGTNSGTRFSYDGKGGVIVGFHGHDNKYLEAIGVYVKPESLALPQTSTCQINSVLEFVLLVGLNEDGKMEEKKYNIREKKKYSWGVVLQRQL
ncbi:putative jacalin-like lectin domain-containing protein, partial [Tanacetum coccineum]